MRVSITTAATRPLNLLILFAAIGAGLTIALWLLPVGLVAYGALVGLTVFDPQVAQQMQARPRVLRPPRGTPFQAQLDSIARVHAQIGQSVAATSGPLRTTLERVTAQVDSIVEDAYALATKGQTVVAYLHQTNLGDLNAQLVRLDNQIKTTSDTMLKQQYQETRDAVAERLKNAKALGTYHQRIVAQLENICANLDNVLAETVRLRAAPAVDATVSTDSVSQRLADVRADMDALGHVLDTALTGVA
jgi:chaperonin cofactor prefoldin